MSLNSDSTQVPAYSPAPGGLADRAHPSSAAQNPRNGNTGVTSRHIAENGGLFSEKDAENAGEATAEVADAAEHVAQSDQQPAKKRAKSKRTRKKATSPAMEAFLSQFSFDYLVVTIPNPVDGKGSKSSGPDGHAQEVEAVDRMMSFVTQCDLRKLRIGKGSDSYLASCHFAYDPTDSHRLMTVRAGHGTNMPGLEIPGGRGACATLAPAALSLLGPVMLARADVALDVKREGLFDELHALCHEFAEQNRGKKSKMEPPTMLGDEAKGRTVYFGGKQAGVKIYEKGKERIARGTAEPGEEAAADDLVRIEFTVRPKNTKEKHGSCEIAHEKGPGALLGTVLWIRQFVERLAVIVDAADEDTAIISVERVRGRPDPRPVEDRAEHGRSQYAGTFVAEAAKSFVREECVKEHGIDDPDLYDWRGTSVTSSQLVERAQELMQPILQVKAESFCREGGMGKLETREEEQQRVKADFLEWMDDYKAETEGAQELLRMAEQEARERAGMPVDESDEEAPEVDQMAMAA